MRFNLQNWIEEVKAKPEHIRQRYAIGCVFASMFFVLIVWSLTVSESFKRNTAAETAVGPNGLLPKASDFSLDQLLRGETTLDGVDERSVQEFLQEATENRVRPNIDEEGIAPKEITADNPPEPSEVPPTIPR